MHTFNPPTYYAFECSLPLVSYLLKQLTPTVHQIGHKFHLHLCQSLASFQLILMMSTANQSH